MISFSRKNRHAIQKGFTIIEFLLFLGLVAFLGSVVIGLLISSQDARIRQRTIAEVEQTGARLLLTMTRDTRRAEDILDPPAGETGSVLNLQMSATAEFPTIFASTESGQLLVVRRTSIEPLLSDSVRVSELAFRNVSSGGAKGVLLSFRLEADILTPSGTAYGKRFEALVTLYPDDFGEAGGCSSCTMTGCVNGTYNWSYCLYETCTPFSAAFSC